MPNFFDNGKYVRHYENFQLYLRLGFKFDTLKRIEVEKNGDKDGKALYKLMNNGKAMVNRRVTRNFSGQGRFLKIRALR